MGEPGGEQGSGSLEELEREKLRADIAVARNEVKLSQRRQIIDINKLRVEVVKTVFTGAGVAGGILLVLKQIGLITLGG